MDQKANLLKRLNDKTSTVAVLGLGYVGLPLAVAFAEAGYKVIGAADIAGGVFNPNGLDIPALLVYAAEHKALAGYPGGDPIGKQEILEQDCEVLLPAATESETYDLEYGTDTIEIHRDAILPGQKVLIIDDLCATGGTALAVARLVQRLGGQVVEFGFIIDLPDLGGSKKILAAGFNYYSQAVFDGE